MTAIDIERFFAADGPLATAMGSGFQARPAQVDLARAVADCLATAGCLVAEAGTGTGKTFAYLAPVVLSGQKALISTATKTLQEQLFFNDLPRVRKAAGTPLKAALLKGRSNYLCLYRLNQVAGFRAGFSGRDATALAAVQRWAKNTRMGDIAEVASVPESSPVWPMVTSTADNCLGQECPVFNDCHLVRARRAAQDADVVVVNHHLLWADWTLKNDGFGEILPDVRAVVVDEAHQFLESAMQFLGIGLSFRQLSDLATDTEEECRRDAADAVDAFAGAEQLAAAARQLRAALGETTRREAWHSVAAQADVRDAVEAVRERLDGLAQVLKPLAIRGRGVESCAKRAVDLLARLGEFLSDESGDAVCWFETRKRGFTLQRTPLTIGQQFGQFRATSKAAWVFTSATLTVAGEFGHFLDPVGLRDADCRIFPSPFDYAHQALLLLPDGMPDPSSANYDMAVLRAAWPVLKASEGRAFLLFTSNRALSAAAELLPKHLPYPFFVQGTEPKTVLLDRFKRSGNGVLLGTSTFWEGVDVPGPALSCVIIDRLPFASPGDPVLKARLDALRREGQDPFRDQQLPAAVIALKQGMGRLIRGESDRGVMMLCDPRVTNRPYGKTFLKSLPQARLTRSMADVRAFFDRSEDSAAS